MNQTLLFLKAKAILIESIILGQCLLTFDLLLDTCKKLLSRKKIKIKLFIFLDHFFEQRSNPKAGLQLRKWSKTRIVWLDSTRLGKYSKYLCKKLVFDSRSSWISGHYSTYYLTPNIGQISNIFQIARLGQVICRSLLSTIAQLIIPPPPPPTPQPHPSHLSVVT